MCHSQGLHCTSGSSSPCCNAVMVWLIARICITRVTFQHLTATHLLPAPQQHVDLVQIASQAPVVQLLMHFLVQLQPSPPQLSAQVNLCQSGHDSESVAESASGFESVAESQAWHLCWHHHAVLPAQGLLIWSLRRLEIALNMQPQQSHHHVFMPTRSIWAAQK